MAVRTESHLPRSDDGCGWDIPSRRAVRLTILANRSRLRVSAGITPASPTSTGHVVPRVDHTTRAPSIHSSGLATGTAAGAPTDVPTRPRRSLPDVTGPDDSPIDDRTDPTPSLPPALIVAAEALGRALGDTRVALGRGIRSLMTGDEPPVRDPNLPVVGDPGIFGPDSVTWRIHADGAMLIGGVRALLLQMLHPLAMAGVAEHSDYRRHPTDRLATTSRFVATTTFGTTEQADAAFAMVERVHRRVVGTAPDGRPYAANDPHLIAWVHHAEVDSFLRAYQRFGAAPLSAIDADRYVEEMGVICERLGGTAPARSVAELERWLDDIRPELTAGSQALDAARWLVRAPLPLAARPAYAVIAPAAIGLLPPWAIEELQLPSAPALDPLIVRPAANLVIRTLEWAVEGAFLADQPS